MIERIHFLYPANNQIHLNAMGGAKMDGIDSKTFLPRDVDERKKIEFKNKSFLGFLFSIFFGRGSKYLLRDSNRNIILSVFFLSKIFPMGRTVKI